MREGESVRQWYLVLTSCNQYNLRHCGFAWTWHSKYTSSPSLMSSADNVEPSRSVTMGGSVAEEEEEEGGKVKGEKLACPVKRPKMNIAMPQCRANAHLV